MQLRRTLIAALLIGGAGVLGGQAAPPAVTVAVPRDAGPVSALAEMIRAASAGDQAALMDCFAFTDPAAKQAAQVLLAQVASEARLYSAYQKAFPSGAVPANDELNALSKALTTAKVDVNGSQAKVTTAPDQAYFLVLRNGKWKIDFDKTQAGMGALPDAQKLEAIRQQTAALDAFTDELKKNPDPNPETAIARLDAIERMVAEPIIGPPFVGAQTRPASTRP